MGESAVVERLFDGEESFLQFVVSLQFFGYPAASVDDRAVIPAS